MTPFGKNDTFQSIQSILIHAYINIYIHTHIHGSTTIRKLCYEATKYSCRVIAEEEEEKEEEEEEEEAVAERPKGSKQFQRKDYVSADRGE